MAAQQEVGFESGLVLLSSVSAILKAEEADELRWYLRRDQLYVAEQSTFAAQLERACMYSHGSRPCRKCGGTPKSWRPGTGFAPKNGNPYRRELVRFRKAEAKRLGIVVAPKSQIARLALIEIKAVTPAQLKDFFPELPPLQCRECPACRGRGVVARTSKARAHGALTARPTCGKQGSAPSYEMNEGDIEKQGRISSRLRKVRAVSPQAAMALETYYAPNGSLGSLWQFTPAGHKLLRKNPQHLPPAELFANERAAQRQNPNPTRQALLDAARIQAMTLLEHACRTWNEVA